MRPAWVSGLGAMAFHWSLLVVLFRHLRLFLQPVPSRVVFVQQVDGFFEVGMPVLYVTTLVFLAALAYLLLRRLAEPQVRYISLLDDFFLLFLLLGIGLSGFWLRHIAKTDLVGIKQLALGLVGFRPRVPPTINALFFAHVFLVSVLLACIPFSKMMHI